MIVTLEKREKVLSQVVFIEIRQGPDNAEIECDVTPKVRRIKADLNIARVHVGVEKAVTKHLGEENLHAFACQLRDIHAGCAQRLDLADRHADHALHDEHSGRAKLPVHLGHE